MRVARQGGASRWNGAQEEKINIHAGKAAKAGILHFDIELDLKSDSILTRSGP